MTRPVVLDNTVLINFSGVGRPDVAAERWVEGTCTTRAVLEEYRRGTSGGRGEKGAWDELPCIDLNDAERAFARKLRRRLGAGEASCIALAQSRGGLFVSDDADARKVARANDVPVTGTLGILADVVQTGRLSLETANQLLSSMIEGGYRSPMRRIDTLIR